MSRTLWVRGLSSKRDDIPVEMIIISDDEDEKYSTNDGNHIDGQGTVDYNGNLRDVYDKTIPKNDNLKSDNDDISIIYENIAEGDVQHKEEDQVTPRKDVTEDIRQKDCKNSDDIDLTVGSPFDTLSDYLGAESTCGSLSSDFDILLDREEAVRVSSAPSESDGSQTPMARSVSRGSSTESSRGSVADGNFSKPRQSKHSGSFSKNREIEHRTNLVVTLKETENEHNESFKRLPLLSKNAVTSELTVITNTGTSQQNSHTAKQEISPNTASIRQLESRMDAMDISTKKDTKLDPSKMVYIPDVNLIDQILSTTLPVDVKQEQKQLEDPNNCEPSTPLFPPITRKRPIKRDRVFVKITGSDSWKRGRVSAVFKGEDQQVNYRIKTHDAAPVFTPCRNLAYRKPPKVPLPLGSRVIACRQRAQLYHEDCFTLGVILESANKENHNRYLVFFDRGDSRYLKLKRIRLLCESSNNVWDDFDEYRDFVMCYFKEHPNRDFVEVKPGDEVVVKVSGLWQKGTVVQSYCSLAEVAFGNGETEWILRNPNFLTLLEATPLDEDKPAMLRKETTLNKSGATICEQVTAPGKPVTARHESMKDLNEPLTPLRALLEASPSDAAATLNEIVTILNEPVTARHESMKDLSKPVTPLRALLEEIPSDPVATLNEIVTILNEPMTALNTPVTTLRTPETALSKPVPSKPEIEGHTGTGAKPAIVLGNNASTISSDNTATSILIAAGNSVTAKITITTSADLNAPKSISNDGNADTTLTDAIPDRAVGFLESKSDAGVQCFLPYAQNKLRTMRTMKRKFISRYRQSRSKVSKILSENHRGPERKNLAVLAEEMQSSPNPLAVPLLNGWQQKCISRKGMTRMYIAPCGSQIFDKEGLYRHLSSGDSQLTLNMFTFDAEVDPRPFVYNEDHVVMKDISFGTEKIQVSVFNDLDESLPEWFNYSIKYSRRSAEATFQADPQFQICCDCQDDCSDKTKCVCCQITMEPGQNLDPNEGYHYRLLLRKAENGIVECNTRCKCRKDCLNRVAQNNLQQRLQIFKTVEKGWGVRTMYDIPMGTFICNYAGELLTKEEAQEEGEENGDEYFVNVEHTPSFISQKAKEGSERQVDDPSGQENDASFPTKGAGGLSLRILRKRTKQGVGGRKRSRLSFSIDNSDFSPSDRFSCSGRHRTEAYVVNAKHRGNVARYFNHSCDPNMFAQNVLLDTQDLPVRLRDLPTIAFFASRMIPAGEELTWDYGYRSGSVPGKEIHCKCASANCRGRLI